MNDRNEDYYNDWEPPNAQLVAYRSITPIYQELPENYSELIFPTLLDDIRLEFSDYNCSRCLHYILGRCLVKECRTNKTAICNDFEKEPPKAEQIYDMRLNKSEKYEKEVLLLDMYYGPFYSKKSSYSKQNGSKVQICTFLGLNHFSLLRIFFQPSINVGYEREIELNNVKMDIIHIQRQRYHQLSIESKNRLKDVIHLVIDENEDLYRIFNTARSVKSDLHQLKLLPGLTPQMRFKIIEERKNERFNNLKDISNRISKDITQVIAARILKELQGYSSYYLFSIPTFQKSQSRI